MNERGTVKMIVKATLRRTKTMGTSRTRVLWAASLWLAAATAFAGPVNASRANGPIQQRVREADPPPDGSTDTTTTATTAAPTTDPSASQSTNPDAIPGTPAASTGPTAAQTAAAQSFDASAWRGIGLERVKWLYRVYVARKPSVDEVEAFVQAAGTPDQADQTMLKLIAQSGSGGLADNFQAAFEKRVDGFVHGTQAAAMGGGERGAASFNLDDDSALSPAGDLNQMLAPLVQAATDDAPKCGDAASVSGCFGAWLADWIQPGNPGGAPAPQGQTYLALLQAIAATF
jgi:hypothetical protein